MKPQKLETMLDSYGRRYISWDLYGTQVEDVGERCKMFGELQVPWQLEEAF